LHPAYCSLLIKFDPRRTTHQQVERDVRERMARMDPGSATGRRQVEIPVCYGVDFGPDLAWLAELRGLLIDDLIGSTRSRRTRCSSWDSCPALRTWGRFPRRLPLRVWPRRGRRVEAGSVGIAGHQTGVYPFPVPGGWQIIGKTPLAMFRADRDPMSLLAVGDEVRFRPIPFDEYVRIERGGGVIRVEAPGLMTTVQDLGREGFGRWAYRRPGAADPVALRIGTVCSATARRRPALELTLLGGTFRFEIDTWIAITGSDFGPMLDGAPLDLWAAHPVRAGQIVRMQSTRSGARCYLCVSGGIQVPLFLASASTHVLSGLGGLQGRALRKGDRLQADRPAPPPARRVNPKVGANLAPRRRLRVTEGLQADWFSAAARAPCSKPHIG